MSFSKAIIFDKYVEHFFDKKRNSIGVEREQAKLQLNTLYGIFGRKQDSIETVNIYLKIYINIQVIE